MKYNDKFNGNNKYEEVYFKKRTFCQSTNIFFCNKLKEKCENKNDKRNIQFDIYLNKSTLLNPSDNTINLAYKYKSLKGDKILA